MSTVQGFLRRTNHAVGPVAAGMIIDGLDVLTLGPVGLFLGIPVGILAGHWLAKSLGLSNKSGLLCAAAAGLYCAVPFTEVLPLGTIVGALCRFHDASDVRDSGDGDSGDGDSGDG
ncbi:MAG: hypothetical protein KDA89_21120, partial [Planctomycetaceae bacterium]|nr:hypothetical protein [Planctomycetaceae bacterium]